jgi:hypothetical protein
MTFRADHIAGFCFVAIGLLVIALSGDLPFGTLSSPGAGFMPMLLAITTIILGGALMLRASESPPFSMVEWTDLSHAAMVIGAIAAGTAAFLWLGFIVTMSVLMVALLVVVERRRPLFSVIYSLSAVLIASVVFQYVLKTPLVVGIFGF